MSADHIAEWRIELPVLRKKLSGMTIHEGEEVK
jgi:hypothetical protein